MDEARFLELVEAYLERSLDGERKAALERLLIGSPDARRLFRAAMRRHAHLREIVLAERGRAFAAAVPPVRTGGERPRRPTRPAARERSFWIAAAAACTLAAAAIWFAVRSSPARPAAAEARSELSSAKSPTEPPRAVRELPDRTSPPIPEEEPPRHPKPELQRPEPPAASPPQPRTPQEEAEDAPPSEEPVRAAEPPQKTIRAAAKLSKIRGVVFVFGEPGSDERFASAGQDLLEGEGLNVQAQSRAVVEYPDSTRFDVEPESRIRIGRGPGIAVTLIRGTLTAAVARQQGDTPVVVATPHAEVKVLGTRFTLTVNGDATKVRVEEGRVSVRRGGDGRSVTVRKGWYVIVASGARLGPKRIPQEKVLFRDDFETSPAGEWPLGWGLREPNRTAFRVLEESGGKFMGCVSQPAGTTQHANVPAAWEGGFRLRFRLGLTGPSVQRCGVEIGPSPDEPFSLEYDAVRGRLAMIERTDGSPRDAAAVDLGLEPGRWHLWRIEYDGETCACAIDGETVLSARPALPCPSGSVSFVSKGADSALYDDVLLTQPAPE